MRNVESIRTVGHTVVTEKVGTYLQHMQTNKITFHKGLEEDQIFEILILARKPIDSWQPDHLQELIGILQQGIIPSKSGGRPISVIGILEFSIKLVLPWQVPTNQGISLTAWGGTTSVVLEGRKGERLQKCLRFRTLSHWLPYNCPTYID